jgi:hypothetical protein
MIEVGDQISFKATCLYKNESGYYFVLNDGPFNFPINIQLSETDKNFNLRVEQTLEKWKINNG